MYKVQSNEYADTTKGGPVGSAVARRATDLKICGSSPANGRSRIAS